MLKFIFAKYYYKLYEPLIVHCVFVHDTVSVLALLIFDGKNFALEYFYSTFYGN